MIKSRPLEATAFEAGASGSPPCSTSLDFLSEGMPVPDGLSSTFEFAAQKSELAGTIRGSFSVIRGEY